MSERHGRRTYKVLAGVIEHPGSKLRQATIKDAPERGGRCALAELLGFPSGNGNAASQVTHSQVEGPFRHLNLPFPCDKQMPNKTNPSRLACPSVSAKLERHSTVVQRVCGLWRSVKSFAYAVQNMSGFLLRPTRCPFRAGSFGDLQHSLDPVGILGSNLVAIAQVLIDANKGCQGSKT